jgi:putative transposase
MSNLPRSHATFGTYFITAGAYRKQHLLQSDPMAQLLINVLMDYRAQSKFLLHEFVVMPTHTHLLLTPLGVPLERAMQYVKGGFSYRAGRDLGVNQEIWQPGYYDHRVRDAEEYAGYVKYIRLQRAALQRCATGQRTPLAPFTREKAQRNLLYFSASLCLCGRC